MKAAILFLPIISAASLGETTKKAGDWHVDQSKSPIDDSQTLFFTTLLKNERGTAINPPTMLFIRHEEGKLNIYIMVNGRRFSEGKCVTRFDDAKAVSEDWLLGTQRDSLFSPNPKTFLQRAIGSKRLVIRCTPLASSPITAVIDLSGFHELASSHAGQLGFDIKTGSK